MAAGRRVDLPVSTQHLPATILDLVALSADRPLPGDSLAELLKPEAQAPAPTPSPAVSELINACPSPPDIGRSPIARGEMRSVLLGNVKYVANGDGSEELYDLRQDPKETRNLVRDPDYAAALRRCRQTLAATRRAP